MGASLFRFSNHHPQKPKQRTTTRHRPQIPLSICLQILFLAILLREGCFRVVQMAVHRFRSPSMLRMDDSKPLLALASTAEDQSGKPFFQGSLKNPRITARAMRVLARVAGERWFDANAVAASRMIDPVITSGCGQLRLENFSSCRSLYARLDLTPEGLEIGHQRRGTTNVDFNQELRNSLGQVRDTHPISVCVSEDSFVFVRGAEAILEKKVELPESWLRGFASVQSLAQASEPFAILGNAALQKLFQQFPVTGDGRDRHWIHHANGGLRASRMGGGDALALTGLKRLQCLRELVPFAEELHIHRHPSGALSLWTLSFKGLRLTLGLSAEVWRGFSGEGAALDDLVEEASQDLDEEVQELLAGREPCDPADLAISLGKTLPDIRSALARLASQGLVGFDHITGHCFERVLPGSEALVGKSNPRLLKAKKWVEEGKVSFERQEGSAIRSSVAAGTGVPHLVAIDDTVARCTCFWYGRFGTSRGPCSHVLATRLAVGEKQL